jgi:ketosteroid isomerase-like protein
MDRDEVMGWVARYVKAWREHDARAVEQIFTEDVRYRPSPYAPAMEGHDAVKAFWLDDDDPVFTIDASPVAIEGTDAVVRAEVRYGDPVHQEYRDLWVLRFAADGRVAAFEEWAYWPGKPHAADAE